jgi:FMN phosphatase YigB (HAD superfamily)
MKYYCDNKRHLVCDPYSKENLHKMAEDLGIKKCWFHKDHYDIPKTRIEEIMAKCIVVSPKEIVRIIKK